MPIFGVGVCQLLARVETTGSLRRAAADMGMAYSKAWLVVRRALLYAIPMSAAARRREPVVSSPRTGRPRPEDGRMLARRSTRTHSRFFRARIPVTLTVRVRDCATLKDSPQLLQNSQHAEFAETSMRSLLRSQIWKVKRKRYEGSLRVSGRPGTRARDARTREAEVEWKSDVASGQRDPPRRGFIRINQIEADTTITTLLHRLLHVPSKLRCRRRAPPPPQGGNILVGERRATARFDFANSRWRVTKAA